MVAMNGVEHVVGNAELVLGSSHPIPFALFFDVSHGLLRLYDTPLLKPFKCVRNDGEPLISCVVFV